VREAEAWKCRRKLAEADGWGIRLIRLSFAELPALGSGEIKIERPITLICGPNGVGKSNLLQAAWAASDAVAWQGSSDKDLRLTSGEAVVEFEVDGKSVERSINFAADAVGAEDDLGEVEYINSWKDATRYQEKFLGSEKAEHITEGFGALELDKNDIEALSYLVGKDYAEVKLYEVEADEVVPFFEVKYGSESYDSRHMGTGELCIFHIWWRLKRAKSKEALFIEEPEAFLSFGSQMNLAKFIAKMCCEKTLCFLISTHSPAFIEFYGLAFMRVVSRGAGGFYFVEGEPRPRLLGQIGVNHNLRAIAFVEDRLAKAFLISLLERIDPVSRSGIYIEICDGEGEISKRLEALAKVGGPVKFLGFYDGDMQGKMKEALSGVATYLPAEEALEAEIKGVVLSDLQLVEERLGIPNIRQIIDPLEGKDYHEWFGCLAADLGMTAVELFQALVPLWLDREPAKKAVDEFNERLHDLLGPVCG
jgi:predicted ATPase